MALTVKNFHRLLRGFFTNMAGLILEPLAEDIVPLTGSPVVFYRSDVDKLRLQKEDGTFDFIASEAFVTAALLGSGFDYGEVGDIASVALAKAAGVSNEFARADHAHDLAADVVLETNLANTIADSSDTRTGAGAVSVTKRTTLIDTTGGAAAITIAAGTRVGQRKTLFMKVDAGDATLTGTGFTSIVFSAVGQFAELEWTGAAWDVVGLGGIVAGPAYTV